MAAKPHAKKTRLAAKRATIAETISNTTFAVAAARKSIVISNAYVVPDDFAANKDEAAKSPNGKKKTEEAALKAYCKDWRTYQLSDHNLRWIRLRTNDSPKYLKAIVGRQQVMVSSCASARQPCP